MANFEFSAGELMQGIRIPTGKHIVIMTLNVTRIRMVGMFFDLNKCFLLPSAMGGIKVVKKRYDRKPDAKLLVIGHTDTSGKPQYNETLSLERAEAVAAYLVDNVDYWDAFFEDKKPAEKRWGIREIQYMLTVLPQGKDPYLAGGDMSVDGIDGPETKAAVEQFQASVGLTVDGKAGPQTRKALITAYMDIDDTTLPQGATITTHGCGENFPAEDTGDGVKEKENRRVEIFFFDSTIYPPAKEKISKKGATDYPQWRNQLKSTIDVRTGATILDTFRLRLYADPDQVPLLDDKFRLYSADGFEQIVEMPANVDPNADYIDLIFYDVPVDGIYSLEILCSSGDSYLLLENIAFDELENAGNDPSEPFSGDPLELEPDTIV